MRKFSPHAAFVAIATVAALAACHAAAPYLPGGSAAVRQTAGIAVPQGVTRETGAYGIPDGIPACHAKPVRLPGDYYLFYSGGKVKHGKFREFAFYSNWKSVHVTKGTPPPTASPSPSPSPPPEYVYYGTYALKQGAGGCAYLIVTANGKRFRGFKFNAQTYGSPKFKDPYVNETLIEIGPLTISIKGLSRNGGSGTFTMLDIKGKAVNSGTVTFVGRVLLK
ncbi:MAG TPA: hypothetical protein VJP76_09260 [Candidatus Tumulicola sp.]|nr:hypothetical protein [Candidatus Tumulicola sp.]